MKKLITACILCIMGLLILYPAMPKTDTKTHGFELIKTQELSDFGGTAYYYEHKKNGAKVFYVDNGSENREFSLGFLTPPSDSKGANHVLEHALLCGSEKYPTKNIMHYLEAGTLASVINAKTMDDYTYYEIKTENETEYYNLMDVYLNGIFHPLLLSDENIFKQQGIRLEYVDGHVQYNGIVYNELHLKSLDTTENSLSFLADKLYTTLYGQTAPSFSSGGSLSELKELTYDDLIQVYKKYYVPSNSITYLAGKQDIEKTLLLLDEFFHPFKKQTIPFDVHDTKCLPEKEVYEYNVGKETETVDIGFMSAGIPMSEPDYIRYARSILFDIILKKLDETYPLHYTIGGQGGGIDNSAIIISGIPVSQKEEAIQTYHKILNDFSEHGIDEAFLKAGIAEHFEYRNNSYYYPREGYIFDGILYQNDPFAFAAISEAQTYLENNTHIFDEVLNQYFLNNPYSITVVSGNHDVPEQPLIFSEEELKAIQKETEAFQIWADEPTPKHIIENLPLLGLEEVYEAPDYAEPVFEQENGIDFYYTKKEPADDANFTLYFPISANTDEYPYLQLMVSMFRDKLSEHGMFLDLMAAEDYKDDTVIHPQLLLSAYGTEEELLENLKQAVSILNDQTIFDQENLKQYLVSAPQEILENGYRDPYFLSYELKQSVMSAGSRFYSLCQGSIGQGSVPYYHFLKQMDLNTLDTVSETLSGFVQQYLTGSIPTAEYIGASGYDKFKAEISLLFQHGQKPNLTTSGDDVIYDSAAVITKLTSADHFMLAGNIRETNVPYSGKMDVLARVISTNYLLPEMRGKYGAYGTTMFIDKTGVTASVAGIRDVDLAIEVWSGISDWLRTLDMTQNELDAIIVPAVKEYDEYYNDSQHGALLALTGKTVSDIKKVRDEMLDTKVSDLINYADFIDKIIAQNHIFAVINAEDAERARFDFAYYADGETLEVVPKTDQ